jgi:hypothetical protein
MSNIIAFPEVVTHAHEKDLRGLELRPEPVSQKKIITLITEQVKSDYLFWKGTHTDEELIQRFAETYFFKLMCLPSFELSLMQVELIVRNAFQKLST